MFSKTKLHSLVTERQTDSSAALQQVWQKSGGFFSYILLSTELADYSEFTIKVPWNFSKVAVACTIHCSQ